MSNEPQKRATIFDIANALGISHTTVSRALNNSPKVKISTRKKILQTAHKLNYVPNQNARGLNQGRTYTIGLFFTDLQNGTSALFLTSIILNIRSQLPENYFLSINSISSTDELGVFDGVIVVSQSKKDQIFIDKLISENIPVVVLNRHIKNRNIYNYWLDNYEASRKITLHALNSGSRNVGIIQGKSDYNSTHERSQGYLDALSFWTNKYPHRPLYRHLPLKGDYSSEGGYLAMKTLLQDLDNLPDYVFIESDDMAIGALKAINEASNLAKRIRISGFDDTKMAAFSIPALTTIHSPIAEMTTLGVATLNRLLNKGSSTNTPLNKRFECPIIFRETLPKK
ncbi:LacI family DNA-binding transcriptional regulator [Pediococcus pentosaceus]|uniref:LacI family DNA-binding transcriptional regulator n=1 Tax=Pediococcus pentosaceus TaxID=1255 RepID=UPI0027E430FA|nr:LacI family DNA-binding transcriptional regulator [Pediococcus pentosaceus]MDQ7253315.1 LacI family transcriptional regulator [Pediococcus pentosaceus]